MRTDLFHQLCEELGYEAGRVLSVRLTPGKAVVVFADSAGILRKATHTGVELDPDPRPSSPSRGHTSKSTRG
jgi:hypothetical protein